MDKKREHYILSLVTWIIILVFWFLVTNLNMAKSTLLPSPQRVVAAFLNIMKYGYNSTPFYIHLAMSLGRLLLAVLLALVTAIPLGLMSGYFPKVSAIIDSLVNFYRPLPPMAYYVLLIMWLGIDEESKVMLLYLATFAPIYVACSAAVGKVKNEYLLSAKTLGADPAQVFTRVVLPATMPDVFTGVRTAVGVGYTTLVSAEMIAATSGMGWMVMDAYNYLKTDVVFVGIIIMGITGIIIDVILKKIEKKLVFWADK